MGEETEYKKGRTSRALAGILLLCFCIAMAAVIVLAVLLVNRIKNDANEHEAEKHTTESTISPEVPVTLSDPCGGHIVDVAVVGAGVSGVYSAYKLSQNYDWDIHIFEVQDRIGGRTFSVEMPGISDFKVDLGAMRLKRTNHKRLVKLVEELGLTIQPFSTPTVDESLFYLRGKLLNKDDIASGNIPYALTDKEMELSPDISALWRYWSDLVIANESKNLDDPYEKVCTDGKKAYEKGHVNAFREVASMEAIEYHKDMIGFHSITQSNWNFAEWTEPGYVPGGAFEEKTTLKEGFQSLTLTMMDRILQNTRNQLFKQHELVSVSHNGTLAFLQFMNKGTSKIVDVCAKEVILGLPVEALKRINFVDRDLSQTLEELLPAVQQNPAAKTYLVYDRPWWRDGGKGPVYDQQRQQNIPVRSIQTDLQIGQLLDIGVDSTTGKSVLLSYSDWWTNVLFWAPYMENGVRHVSQINSEFMASQKLIRQLNLQLAEVFNLSVSDIPIPEISLSHGWFAAPYWGGWHGKTGGYHFPTVMDKVLKPVENKGVYIVGEAFSDNYQAWVEGALQTTQNMLTKHFNVFE